MKLYESEVKVVTKPKGWGTRHTLTLLGFCAFAISYSMRFNLSMAIVAMTNSSRTTKEDRIPVFKVDQCNHFAGEIHKDKVSVSQTKHPSLDIEDEGETDEVIVNGIRMNDSAFNRIGFDGPSEDIWTSAGEFSWDEEEQGIILGSFFWGYIITQLPGGCLGQRFGGKWPLGVGILITAIFTLLTPFAAHLGMEALIACRIFQGLGEGVTMPAMHALLAVWIPVEERSKLSATVYGGMSLGTSLTMTLSGYITHYFGWPAVFYATGSIAIVWFVFWSLLVFDTPSSHPRIGPDEAEYISASLRTVTSNKTTNRGLRTPWKHILVSIPFWGILLCQALETWGLYTLLQEIPTYMKTVLHFDMEQNSILSALPHLLSWILTLVVTHIGDNLIEKKLMAVVTVRKTCNTIGLWGAAAAMLGVAYSGCDRVATTILLTVAVGAYGTLLGGVVINLIDIAPNYASILMGVTNTFATLSGFGAPWMAGYILKGNPSLEQWRMVFILAASICFIANLLYILMASGKEESWNDVEGMNKENIPTITHPNNIPGKKSHHWVIPNPKDLEQPDIHVNRDIPLEDVPRLPRNA